MPRLVPAPIATLAVVVFLAPLGLPAGKYLIKAYVDTDRRLAAQPALLLGPDEFVGQTPIEARWRAGFPQAKVVSAASLQK